MSLPLHWVEKIFLKLGLAYGRDFLGRWEGMPIAEVKADWAHELAGLEKRPDCIKHALEHLPPAKPPTVYEFRNLALQASQPEAPRLERPRAQVDVIARAVAGVGRNEGAIDPKAWAHRLRARHEAGDRLNANQIRCYKNALGLHPGGAQL